MNTSPPIRPTRVVAPTARQPVTAGFALSLVANLILLAVVVVLAWRTRAPDIPPATIAPVATTHRTAHATTPPDDALRPQPGSPELTPTAVAELERAGIAPDAIAEGLINDHTFRYDKHVRELQRKYAPKPVPRREMLAVARAGEEERTRELKEAMGEEGYRAWDKEKTLSRVNMGGIRLTAEEAEKAYQLQKAFDEKEKARQMAQEDGITDPKVAQAEYDAAQKQLDSDLEKLVGKDRIAALRGAPDPVAEVTRRYEGLNPTTEQATAVLQAESDIHAREAALVQRVKDNPAEAANLTAELKALADAREQNLRQIFGPDYDTVKQQNDSTYQKLTQYAGAWDLPEQQLQPVYDALAAYHDQSDQMRRAAEMSEAAGKPVNWHDVNAAIAQSRLQTEAALANLIGGERVRRLQQNGLLDVR